MIFQIEHFYAIAALLTCLAYLLRSMLWLRISVAAGAVVFILAGAASGEASMVGWNSAYLAINLAHIALLLLERTAITLPEETRGIYQRCFSTLSTREFSRLINCNGFSTFQDQNIIDQDEVPDRLFFVLRGEVDIVRDGETIARLGAGAFIGEMSFLSKEPASANAWARNFVQCAYWTHDDLEKVRAGDLGAYDKFIAIVGCDLVRKLRQKNERRPDPSGAIDFVV